MGKDLPIPKRSPIPVRTISKLTKQVNLILEDVEILKDDIESVLGEVIVARDNSPAGTQDKALLRKMSRALDASAEALSKAISEAATRERPYTVGNVNPENEER